MKKTLVLLLSLVLIIPFGLMLTVDVSADTEILYVKEGGTGDGSSEQSAYGSVLDAVNAAAAFSKDAEVVIVGEVVFDFSAAYSEPEHQTRSPSEERTARQSLRLRPRERSGLSEESSKYATLL